jgi:diguanylate cyclase (GGDEF)-like protein
MSVAVSPTIASPDAARRYSPLSMLILGANPKQRGTVMLSMYASAVYVACLGLVAYFVHVGFMTPEVGSWMMGGLVATIMLIYAMLRSGWSMRFKDPALTVFQIILAITWDCVSYALIGPAHAGMMMLMELSLFFGIFSLNARSARISLAYTLVAAGTAMALRSTTDPDTFPPDLQFIYFAALCLVTSMIARLATSLTGMRRELEAQRHGLSTALERIQEASSRDALTGLHNRHHMMEMLAHEVDRHQRFNTGFTLALIDLDHFKQFNDQYGHQTGDAALCCFARQAQAALRSGDVLSRWGGEEFLFLYPESSPADALAQLELLRIRLKQVAVSEQNPELRIRFSAGLTSFNSCESIQKTIERADQALYRAKDGGRDRCEICLGPLV